MRGILKYLNPYARKDIAGYGALLLICCTVTFSFYIGSYMRIPVVPLFATSLGADTVQVGIINSSFLFMAGSLSLPLGMLSDKFGRKLLILSGLLIVSISSFLLASADSPMYIATIYLLFGMGLAAFAPTMMSFVADFSPSTHLGRSYGWYTMAVYIGMSLGPAIGGVAAEQLGFRPVFLLSGLMVMAVFAFVFLLLPRARHVLGEKRRRQTSLSALWALFYNKPLLACWLVTLGSSFVGLGMFVTFVPLHARDQGVNVGGIGIIFAAQSLSNALSRIPFGRLTDSVGSRNTLVVIGLIGYSVSLAGFGIASNAIAFQIAAAFFGLSMGLAFTAIGALIPETVTPEARGLAMGGYNSCIYFGMMLSALIMGEIIDRVGFCNAFMLAAVVNLMFTGTYFLLARRSHIIGS